MKFLISLISLLLLFNLKGLDPVDYVIIVGLVVTFLISVLKGKIRKPSYSISMFFFFFFIGYIFSILFNSYSFSYVMNLLVNVGLFFLIFKSAKSEKAVRGLFFWLSVGATLTGFLALISILLNTTLLPNQFDAYRHDRYLGMFGDPNILGAFLVFLVFYWLSQVFNSRNISNQRTLLPIFFVLTLLMQIAATSSRSSIGGLVLGSLVYLYIFYRSSSIKHTAKKTAKFFIPSFFVICISLVPVYDIFSERVKTILNPTEAEFFEVTTNEEDRFALVYTAAAIAVSMENPLGVGPGQTNSATGFENADGLNIGSHNAFIQVFADNGWLSGTIVLMSIIMLWITSFKNARQGKILYGVDQTVMIASLTSFIFIAMFQDLIQWKIIWVFFAILLAMHQAIPRYKQINSKRG